MGAGTWQAVSLQPAPRESRRTAVESELSAAPATFRRLDSTSESEGRLVATSRPSRSSAAAAKPGSGSSANAPPSDDGGENVARVVPRSAAHNYPSGPVFGRALTTQAPTIPSAENRRSRPGARRAASGERRARDMTVEVLCASQVETAAKGTDSAVSISTPRDTPRYGCDQFEQHRGSRRCPSHVLSRRGTTEPLLLPIGRMPRTWRRGT